MQAQSIVQKNITDLIPYEFNNKIHSQNQIDKIANSIIDCGFRSPILIDENNIILAGNGRLLGAKKAGLTHVPVIQYTDLTEIQKKKYRILDNRLADLAEYDVENLKIELESIGDDELTELFDDIVDIGGDIGSLSVQDDTDSPLPDYTPVRVSDIFFLGEHLLIVGDSTEKNTIETLLGGKKVDLIITDPPYNVAYESSDGMTIQNDDMDDTKFQEFLRKIYQNMIAVQKEGGSIYVFHSDTYGELFRGEMKNSGYKLSQCLIWNKNHIVMGRQDYHWRHEPILYGWKPGAGHSWYGDRAHSTVLDFDKPTKSDLHPTMKPIDLIMYLMKNSSKKGDIVFDPFGGSGSTLIAAENLGRVCRTVELDPKYAHNIIKRYYELTNDRSKISCKNREFDFAEIFDS